MKKAVCLLCLIIFTALMSSCLDFDPDADDLEKYTNFVKEHTVFKTSITASFENEGDISIFEKRLQALGIEVVTTNANEKIVAYEILSHYPFERENANVLSERSNAKVTDAKGKPILSSSDVADIRYEGTFIALSVAEGDGGQFLGEDYYLSIDDLSFPLRIESETYQEQNIIALRSGSFNLNDDLHVPFQKLAVALCGDSFRGKVEVNITQKTERVPEYMQDLPLS